MFAIGFDFHSVKHDQSINVERGYVAGGLVVCIDCNNSPHPVGLHVGAEAGCHSVWRKDEIAIFGDELDREGNLLGFGCLFLPPIL